MAGLARRGQIFGVQVGDVPAQFAQCGAQVVGEFTASGPGGVAVEVPAIGQDGVLGQAALGLEVVAEGADVVGESNWVNHEGAHL